MDKSVFVVGGNGGIERMFRDRGYHVCHNLNDAAVVCFTGGSDVTPELYNDVPHRTTRSNFDRDAAESRQFLQSEGKLKVGICRGAQFLNVMSGGKLWQDVDRHAIGGTHPVIYSPNSTFKYAEERNEGVYEQGEEEDDDDFLDRIAELNRTLPNNNKDTLRIKCTSTHHQMMKPDKETSELWGWAELSAYRDVGSQRMRATDWTYSPDVEIVFYPHTKSMCFQPHPEYGVKDCEELFFTCLDRAAARI